MSTQTREQKLEAFKIYRRTTFGSDTFTRYRTLGRQAILTYGVKLLADSFGAWWLVDAILSHQNTALEAECDGFQVWKLEVKDRSAVLSCEDGNDNVVRTQAIEYTDFPAELTGITIYLENGTLLLPEER